ncbi:MAG: serine/threonine protein kinase [Deltaproteobacteria bacterium]|nr:serine/threonine protein kinase [Deltaproteobacteria bacterium]
MGSPGVRTLRSLGAGGMGRVLLVERSVGEDLVQRCVLKRPHPGGEHDQRLQEEARALCRLRHGNIIGLLGCGADDEGPWLLLEYVDGVDVEALATHARAGAGLTLEECGWVVHEAARGLSAAHGALGDDGAPAPVLHRDVSPQNLLVSCAGEVRVTDFGIARAADRPSLTTTGTVLGNVKYCAPEQLEGRAVGPSADVYGLGRVLEVLLEASTEEARRALGPTASRATRRAVEERHGSMDDLADEVLSVVPTLARGRGSLGQRARAVATTREGVQGALASLLAAERLGDAVPSLPPAPLPAPAITAPRRVLPREEAPPGAPPEVSQERLIHTHNVGEGRQLRVAPRRIPWVFGGIGVLLVAVGTLARPRARARVVPPRTDASLAVVGPVPTLREPLTQAPEVPTEPPTPVPPPLALTHEPPREPPVPRRPHRDAATLVAAPPTTLPSRAPDAGVAAPLPRGTLIVNARPWAEVSVDERPAARSPVTVQLAPGEHRLRVRFSTGEEVERGVSVEAGRELRLGVAVTDAGLRWTGGP